MKRYNLSAMGNIEINSYGNIAVNEVDVLEEFAKYFGMEKGKSQPKNFTGKIEIIITDLTEPLKIEEC